MSSLIKLVFLPDFSTEKYPFPLFIYYIFYREVLWSYINIPFFCKLSMYLIIYLYLHVLIEVNIFGQLWSIVIIIYFYALLSSVWPVSIPWSTFYTLLSCFLCFWMLSVFWCNHVLVSSFTLPVSNLESVLLQEGPGFPCWEWYLEVKIWVPTVFIATELSLFQQFFLKTELKGIYSGAQQRYAACTHH